MKKASSVCAFPILAAGAAIALAAPPALAEEDDDERASGVVEEIVVSATYRDTRLMDTPLTISAVTDHDIVNKGIEDIQTLYQSIPGLAYRSNSQTYNTLTVRGITPPAAGGGATVGVYFDNMPITDANSGGLAQTLGPLFDLERVEVLKGPQGTLYGEGAMGGSIRYITKKPDPSGFDYSAQVNVEAIGESDGLSYRADAMVNIPIGDHLAARAVVYRRDRQGILDQVAPRNNEDSDTFLEDGMRLRVAWYPTDTIEISGMVNVIDGEYGGPGLAFHCFSESTPSDPNGQVHVYELPGTVCEGQFDQFRRRDPYVTHLGHWDHQSGGYDDQEMYNFSIEWELPFADFTSSTSYFDRSTDYSEETSPRYSIGLINLVNAIFGPDLMTGLGGDGAFFRGSERFVQELRLVSNTDSRWQWTVGAYYKDDESQGGELERCHNGGPPAYDGLDTHCWLQYNFYPEVPIPTQQAVIGFLNSIVAGPISYRDFGEEAVFGEVSYAINDQWEVLVGARYADVSYDLIVARSGVSSRSDPANDLGISTEIFSPKVTVTWRPMADFMMYLTYSQGYRPGIVNTSVASKIAELDAIRATNPRAQAYYDQYVGLQTVEGDETVNIELGIKATLAEGRFSFTASLYQIDWEDTIVAFNDEIPDIVDVSPLGFSFNRNEGSAKSQGIEYEFRMVPMENLSVNFGGDWNWTAEIHAAAAGRYLGVDIQPGNRLANAPEYSQYLGVAYDFGLGNFNATARVDAYWVGESWNTANNERPAPAYQTGDAKLLLGRDDWQIGLYVRNMTDERVVYELNQVGYRYGRPRTFGVQLNYSL